MTAYQTQCRISLIQSLAARIGALAQEHSDGRVRNAKSIGAGEMDDLP